MSNSFSLDMILNQTNINIAYDINGSYNCCLSFKHLYSEAFNIQCMNAILHATHKGRTIPLLLKTMLTSLFEVAL